VEETRWHTSLYGTYLWYIYLCHTSVSWVWYDEMAHVTLFGTVAVYYVLKSTVMFHLVFPKLLKLAITRTITACIKAVWWLVGHGLSGMCALCVVYTISYTAVMIMKLNYISQWRLLANVYLAYMLFKFNLNLWNRTHNPCKPDTNFHIREWYYVHNM
jgi:hypothetical protein